MSQAALAQVFGVTSATVRCWVARGCPVVERGGKGRSARFNSAAVAKWREEQIALASSDNAAAMDFHEAKRRRMAAMAVLAEVEADLKVGAVVLIDDVVSVMSSEYAVVRNQLLGLGSKIAPRAAALNSADEVKSLVDAEVCQALENLTNDKKSSDEIVSVARKTAD
jgi:phage terminase Nu1 subunit (DNA packaging protein)